MKGVDMGLIYQKTYVSSYLYVLACIVLVGLITSSDVMAQAAAQKMAKGASKEEKPSKEPKPQKAPSAGPVDEYKRGNPRSCVSEFFKATRDGDFERAAKYLDLRNLPRWMDEGQGPKLARQLKIVLDRTIRVDPELISADPNGNREDGLHSALESIGRIKQKYSDRSVDILLQLVPREDGIHIWKFSNRTVAEIPSLYGQFGYQPFEEKLSKIFPDITFLGWQLWQWFIFLICAGLAVLAARVLTWLGGTLLHLKDTGMRRQTAKFVLGPLRILLFFIFLHLGIQMIGPSSTIRSISQAGTFWTIAVAWTLARLVDLLVYWWTERLQEGEEKTARILLRPVRNIVVVLIILIAALVWLSNVGFNVSALLTGLGVGGIAVALAAQDTLKNFFASIMILLDKPYRIGQRIVVKGHDGMVEEIGLRSTKIRLLTGHLTTVPNDQMANLDVENIGRRPHIRRLTNITITYDTPPEKVEKAIDIIKQQLDDHKGMDPEFPPRVYFNEFNPASLNILVIYWYHPADYWGFQEFGQEINLQIMREFTKEGIKFAFPTNTTYLTQDDGQPLHINLSGETQLPGDKSVA
jgi:MscS family membrane protein